MNKHLHRIVFNAARGLRMAVQETARSAGKAASGTTTLAVMALATLAAGPAAGQIAADPNAPGQQRPTVLTTPGGAVLVNIQTPSTAGISRNLYRQFDVDGKGAVLNNSRTAAQTRLAGQVAGNPWLARGPARIILNEVNSADPSRLRGYVEVAGQRAEVVIANPSGIQVDGAGFINTSRATLTTGTPQFGAAGSLEGFLVQGGTIGIEGAGLDASSTDYVAILSRALQVNAGIWASELKAVTGAGRVTTDAASVQPAAASGAAPVFALDVSALGGMYAGKITLIGTEAGVGVRNAGHIGAGAGGLVVTASGRLENAGTLEGGRVDIVSGQDIHNRGGQIRQAGSMVLQLAGATVRNSAGGQIGTPAPPTAGAGNGSPGAAPASPAVPSGAGAAPPTDPVPAAPPAATAPGSITAQGLLHNEGGRIDAAGTITLQAPNIDNGGGILDIERLAFNGRLFGNAGGQISVRGGFSASADRFDNAGGQLRASDIAISTSGDLDNRGGLLASAGTATLASAARLDNRGGHITVEGHDLALQASALANAGGRIELGGDGRLSIHADRFDGGDGSLRTHGALELRAREAVHAGHLQAGQVTIEATRLRNSGQIVQTGDAQMRIAASQQLDNQGGRIAGNGHDMALQATTLVNTGGSIEHAGTGLLRLRADSIEADNGRILGNGALDIRADAIAHGAGAEMAAEQISIDARRLANDGGQIVQRGTGAMRVAANQQLDNQGGRIAGNGADMAVQSAHLSNAGGRIEHAGSGSLAIQADTLEGGDGVIAGNARLSVQAGQLQHSGRMHAAQIDITAARLDNRGGDIVQTGEAVMHIAAAKALDNGGGRIVANAVELRIETAVLDNRAGTIEHAGQGLLALRVDRLDGDGGRIAGNGTLHLQADQIAHGAGATMSAEQITLEAARLANAGGEIVQRGMQGMHITASEALDNSGGRIAGNAQDVLIQAGRIANAGGSIAHAGSGVLGITTGQLDGGDGRIVSSGALQLQGTQVALAGSVQAEQIAIAADTLDNRGEIVQTGSGGMQLSASGRLTNQGGRIAANARDLRIQAGAVDNTGGTIEHAGDGRLQIRTERLDSSAGRIIGNGALQIEATQLTHGQGASMAAEQITIAAVHLNNAGGDIVQRGAQAMDITASETLNNRGGRIAGSATDMALRSAHIANDGGHVVHGGSGTLALDAGRLDGGDGHIAGNGTLALRADAVTNAGSMQATRIVIATRMLDNRAGHITQTGDQAMLLSASEALNNAGGRIAGNAAELRIDTAALDNTAGHIEHAGAGELRIRADRFDGDAGRIVGNGALQLQAGQIAHGASASMTAAQITIDTERLANGGEIVQTGSAAMRVSATQSLDNSGGRIAGNAQDMALQSASITNAGGRIEHAGSGQLAIRADTLHGGDGHIVGNAALVLHAGQITHAGRTEAARIDIQANVLDNRGGQIVQTGASDMRIAATTQIDNRGGRIVGNAHDIGIDTAALANAGGEITHAGTGRLAIAAEQLDAGDGRILGNGELRVQTGSLAHSGTMQAERIVIDAGTLANAGQIVQTGEAAMRISATGMLDNRGGRIAGNGHDMALQADRIVNADGHIAHAGGGQLALTVTQFDGGDGEVVGNGALALQATGVRHAGRMHAARIAIDAGDLANSGEIVQTGAGSARVTVGGTLDNRAGLIGAVAGSGGDLALSAAQVLNQDGRLQADGTLAVHAATDLHNAGGLLHGGSALNVALGGQLHNASGTLEAAGPAATLALQAAGVGNQDGRIVNTGSGTSRIAAASIVNAGTAGLIGANGALQISSATLENLAGAQVSAGQALDLAVTDLVRNRGSIASDGGLTMEQVHARLDNAGGNIVTAGATRITVAQVHNDGGRIATAAGSQADLSLVAGSLSNLGGTLSADRDLALQISGDHQHTGTAEASRDLALTVGGTLRNTSALQATGTLTAQAQGIDNLAGASIEAGHLALHVAGALRNSGEIGANSAALHSDTLVNQGTITAGALSITARMLDNTGPQALIGATGDVVLQAAQALSNTDGANVYAGRDIRIATGALVNRSATIEASRHIGIDAATVLNERPGVVVERVVTLEEQHTMHMPSWWQNHDRNGNGYTPEGTNYSAYQVFYINPADILEQATVFTPDGYPIGRMVVRTHANDSVFVSGRAGRASSEGKHWGQGERLASTDGTRVLYYTTRQDGIANPDQAPGVGGVWEDALVHTMDTSRVVFDAAYGSCATTCVRLVAPLDYTNPTTTIIRDTQSVGGPHTSLYETRREARVTATEDRLQPGAGAAGRIAAGGDIRIDFSGWMRNDHSDIVAGGTLAAHGADGATFENRATTLVRTWLFDGTHHYANGTSAAYRQPDRTEILGSIGAVFSGQQVDIRAGTIRNIDTSAGSHANLTANLMLSSSTGPQADTTQRIQNGMLAAHTGTGASVNGQAAEGIAADAPQIGTHSSVQGVRSGGAQAIPGRGVHASSAPDANAASGASASRQQSSTVSSGLFQLQPNATGPMLYTTHPRFANAKPWISSDELLQTLGLDPALTLKRLGDGFMEQQRIREQVTSLTGRRLLAGHADDDAQYAALLTAGASFAQAFGLRVGVALTAAQMAQLTSDIVWLERQSVTLPDGSMQEVLAPRLYLAHLGEGALQPHGALIAGDDVRLQGQDILNRGGVVGQAATGRTVLVAERDIVNQGGTVQGANVALVAGRDVRNESLAITQGWGGSDERITAFGRYTSLSNAARIHAGKALQIQAGQDVLDLAGEIGAANTVSIRADRDVVFGTLDSGHESRLQIDSASVSNRTRQAHVGHIAAGGNLALAAGRDLLLRGTQATAGGNAELTGGRHIDLQAAISTQDFDRRSDPAGTRYRHTVEGTFVQGANVQAAQHLTVQAGTSAAGNLTLTGSNLQAGGVAHLGASGDIALNAARETSKAEYYAKSSSSGLLSRKTTIAHTTSTSDTSVTSTVSGGMVALTAHGNVSGEGARIDGDDGVLLQAGRHLDLREARDVHHSSHQLSVKKSGFAGSLMGLPIPGSAAARGASTMSSNTAIESTITSAHGGVALQAGQLAALQGVQVRAERDVRISGAAVAVAGTLDEFSATDEQYRKGTELGIGGLHRPGEGLNARKTDTAADQESTLVRSSLQGANVSIRATGQDGQGTSSAVALSGTRIDTPGVLTLQAERLTLATQTTQSDHTRTSQGSDLAWQKAKGQGTSDQVTHYNQFHAGTLATQVVHVQGHLGIRDSIEALAQQPGMDWVQHVTQDPQIGSRIDWQRVQEAHTKWDYNRQGLTPAGAAVLTAVVAYFTAGAASGVGSSVGQAAAVSAGEGVALAGGGAFLTGTGATISSVVGGAVTAGISTLASQAAVALVNNQGDLGKALNDLGSSASVKGLLTAVATGGVLASLNLNPTGQPSIGAGTQEFMTQLGQNLKAGAARALIGTAIHGGSLGDALGDALTHALIDTGAAQSAFLIGSHLPPGTIGNTLGHAIAGCAAGALRAERGCQAGALGAAIGEIAAGLYDPVANNAQGDTVEFAALMASIAAAVAGGDVEDVRLASQAGANAAANNYLSRSVFGDIRTKVAQENARRLRECESSGCTQEKLQTIDRQVAAYEAVLTLQHKSDWTEQDVRNLVQNVAELLPGVGSAESTYQLITGRSSITDEEVSRFWAAVGMAPIAGGAVRKVGEPSAKTLENLFKRPENFTPGTGTHSIDSHLGQGEKIGIDEGELHALGNLDPENPLSTSIPRNGNRIVINQGYLPTCGPVSCAMTLHTAGIQVDLAKIISQSDLNSAGTTMPRLVKLLNDNGLPAQRVTGATVEDISKATAFGDPAIVRMTLSRGGHAVVVDGVTVRNGQQVVAIRDPAGGFQYFTPIDEFRDSFSGEAAITKVKK